MRPSSRACLFIRLLPIAAAVVCCFAVVAATHDFVHHNPSIKSGAEIEFIANKQVGGWGEELATITCKKFEITLEGERPHKKHPRVEFVTSPVSLNDQHTMKTMYMTLATIAKHMQKKALQDFKFRNVKGRNPSKCYIVIPKEKKKKMEGLRLDVMHSVQVGIGLPLLFFENAVQQEFKENGKFRGLWKMLGMNEVPTDKYHRETSFIESIGTDFRKFLCNDKRVHDKLRSFGMNKDSHPLLPKIELELMEDGFATLGCSSSKFKTYDVLCDILATGFDYHPCEVGGGYSANNFPLFKAETVAPNRLSGVGFVAELRGSNRRGHFKACVSGFVHSGWETNEGQDEFHKCLTKFKTLISKLWYFAQSYPITFPSENY